MTPDRERVLVREAAERIRAFEAAGTPGVGGVSVPPEETADAALVEALGEHVGRSFSGRYYVLARRALEAVQGVPLPREPRVGRDRTDRSLSVYARRPDGSWRAT